MSDVVLSTHTRGNMKNFLISYIAPAHTKGSLKPIVAPLFLGLLDMRRAVYNLPLLGHARRPF